ncbi:MAG: hypothetical protein ACREVL_03535 [Solimonas sp.]
MSPMIRFRFRPPPSASAFALVFSLALLAGCASDPIGPPPPCSGECSSHDDGYLWAQRGALDDPRQCEGQGYSPAFVRGCKDAINDFSQMKPASKGL